MKDTEELVKKWLETFSLTPERYTKKEQRQEIKTPDFKVHKDSELHFFCEVKAV